MKNTRNEMKGFRIKMGDEANNTGGPDSYGKV